MSAPRTSSAWRKLRDARIALALAHGEIQCARCRVEMDFTKPRRRANSVTVDHRTPVAVLMRAHGLTLAEAEVHGGVDALDVICHRCNSTTGGGLSGRLQGRGPGSRGGDPSLYQRKRSLKPAAPALELASPQVEGGDFSRLEAGARLIAQQWPQMPAPRYFSAPPTECPSLYDVIAERLDAALAERSIVLRDFQRAILRAMLTVHPPGHARAGFFRSHTHVVTVGRQLGKGILISALAIATGLFEELGQGLTVHAAANLSQANRIHSQWWRWAEGRGYEVRRRAGGEKILFAEHSRDHDSEAAWLCASVGSLYGLANVRTAVLDEAFDCPPAVYEQALLPTVTATMDSAPGPLIVIASTANPKATDLVPDLRRKAARSDAVGLYEWSIPADAPLTMASLQAASAHWSPGREALMGQQLEAAVQDRASELAVRSQFGNSWGLTEIPITETSMWPPKFDTAPAVSGEVPTGAAVVLEGDPERGRFGVAAAVWDDGSPRLWCATFPSLRAAVAFMNTIPTPFSVHVGASLLQVAMGSGLDYPDPKPIGRKEATAAVPAFAGLCRTGKVAHNHAAEVLAEAAGAVTFESEAGPQLSPKRSRGPSPVTLRAAALAVHACEIDATTQPNWLIV